MHLLQLKLMSKREPEKNLKLAKRGKHRCTNTDVTESKRVETLHVVGKSW
jgi:hypothetical protein